MSDVEKLKHMDPQEIYKKTYIAPKVLQYLVDGDFAKIGNRTKALGFVTILERELGLDLTQLREKIDEFYGLHQEDTVFEIKEKGQSKGKKSWVWLVLALLTVVAGYFFYLQHRTNGIQKEPDAFLALQEENGTHEENQSTVSQGVAESNETNESSELNTTEANVSKEQISFEAEENLSQQPEAEVNETNESTPEVNAPQTLTFIPKKKLWIGIIYLDDYSRKNYVTSSPVEINTSRDQLIVTGHGLFEIEENNKIEDFKERGKQRFIYRAGELEKIDAATFRRYNRGKDW